MAHTHTLTFTCCLLQAFTVTAQDYLGMPPPGTNPTVFAPDAVSLDDRYEFGSVFSEDRQTLYYAISEGGTAYIMQATVVNDQLKHEVVIRSESFGYNDPFLSNDESKLYFISDLNLQGTDRLPHDIWYIKRSATGWSEPINLGAPINTNGREYYMSFTNEGAMYFSSDKHPERRDFNIYKSEFNGKHFVGRTMLGQEINSRAYEADVYVAPDESYMIFCSIRDGGKGEGDLYVSFQESGVWQPAQNIVEVNTPGHELCPFVSRDGQYLFYTSRQDIYWINAKILDNYR